MSKDPRLVYIHPSLSDHVECKFSREKFLHQSKFGSTCLRGPSICEADKHATIGWARDAELTFAQSQRCMRFRREVERLKGQRFFTHVSAWRPPSHGVISEVLSRVIEELTRKEACVSWCFAVQCFVALQDVWVQTNHLPCPDSAQICCRHPASRINRASPTRPPSWASAWSRVAPSWMA